MHFLGVAYPPNSFSYKSVHLCKHNSHFYTKICLALNSYKINKGVVIGK